MRWIKALILLGLVGTLAAAVIFRQLPRDMQDVHQRGHPSGLGHFPGRAGHVWRETQEGDGIARARALEAVILATPRTAHVAGSIEAGMVTYVTRSAVFGFPDFTTIERNVGLIEGGPPALTIVGQARYGLSDLGVNRDRIERWLRQAGG